MRNVLARQPSFRAKVFTEAECAYCDIMKDPAERYAVRFAAKEAVLKALGTGLAGAPLTDIEVRRAPEGKPSLQLAGKAAALAEAAGVRTWLVSLTHTATQAHAMVAGVGARGEGVSAGPVALGVVVVGGREFGQGQARGARVAQRLALVLTGVGGLLDWVRPRPGSPLTDAGRCSPAVGVGEGALTPDVGHTRHWILRIWGRTSRGHEELPAGVQGGRGRAV
ncbi:holo-ACP synthase [Streptomyces sp. RKAG290]|nr:holo-ACP synthase [Streptomyces sp. RKAG290]